MSARERLQRAVVEALKADTRLLGALNAVIDAPQTRAARPYALVDEPIGSDWGTADAEGREFRIVVQLHFDAAHPEAIRGLADAVEAAIGKMPPMPGDGWRIVSRRLLRTRIRRESADRWTADTEFRLRMLRVAD